MRTDLDETLKQEGFPSWRRNQVAVSYIYIGVNETLTMMKRFLLVSIFVLAVFLRVQAEEPSKVHVKITQKHLSMLCLDQKVVKNNQRSWELPLTEHSLIFTIKNQPRSGNSSNVDPGVAMIRFTPENGHRYEIEIRGSAESYSTRVWRKNEWKPVVRDRTTGEIVSTDPEWVQTDCRK